MVDSTELYDGSTIFVFASKPATNGSAISYYDQTILQCTLYNATYKGLFNFTGTQHDTVVESIDRLHPVNATLGMPAGAASQPDIAYSAFMWAYGNILCGSAFRDVSSGQQVPTYTNTLVRATKLGPLLDGATNITLPAVQNFVEKLFQNITFSFIIVPDFQLSAGQASLNTTTIRQTESTYVYRPRDLFIAYGSSVLLSIVCVFIGYIALFRNGVLFSNDFTTLLRTMCQKKLNDLILPQDTIGGDPLPSRIGKASVTFRTGEAHGMSGFTVVETGKSNHEDVELFSTPAKEGVPTLDARKPLLVRQTM